MKALLIVNPSSGGEKAAEYEELATKKLQELFDEVAVAHTEKAGDAERFASEAVGSVDSVFAMGGDGTVNEAISGIASHEERPRFGFFPLGTVNDLARALAIPLDPKEAIESFSLKHSRKIDIGKINDDYFMNVVAIGIIPAAINNVEVEEKTKLGKMAYFLSGLREVRKNESHQFEIITSGQEATETKIESSTLIVGSSNTIGGFESLLPEASTNDGKLHLIYIKDSNLWETIKSIPELLKGVTESNESLGYLTFEKAQIKLLDDTTIETNVDGDPGPSLPVEIQVLPQHITVFCGQEKNQA
ncbi:diacylglycerol/lipid kinase family protein [Enterococcus gallinarum]|uniref:Diacylglycerol kinase family lipid kinase n=1 Tax=Enterococcus gallinarum TaxID=1353 RepID=A0AAE7MQS7_ENTGA|nr:diacylglycerol kinase family protein [Enterococcus gallinarum]MBM6741359.1 diacylglycerol kinase family lipid kinase [Enterococcus gallinarum]MBR8697725.1 diacylglycerol kinase family lipid kinase [Enterococcus gallinarum]MCR1927057.1 diacylglycerol kinase family lipid kinase [Enterococcus gallinarum]MDT2678185.1 diacylglycerol kinase family lipid kinase [Enterococcus gallinarum]MDT2714532.1 diacylglycerol kinase family lipid kinase [Enterococcus gallinarum]